MLFSLLFSYTAPATPNIYTLSLHDALPIYHVMNGQGRLTKICRADDFEMMGKKALFDEQYGIRSEEHTSELQSRGHLVCRLLLEKKKRHLYLRRASQACFFSRLNKSFVLCV